MTDKQLNKIIDYMNVNALIIVAVITSAAKVKYSALLWILLFINLILMYTKEIIEKIKEKRMKNEN